MEELEFRLDFCEECFQMTNHIDEECQKCKAKELKKYNLELNDEEDDEFIENY